ncbi:MAG: acetyl-CoA carboxylase carboxyltransferase subunit beta [Firmicutes bacterium]|nr:acetyl-CoA carboxylase carboxyltransferase subunit beta [Bacillota bacterium]
MYRGLFRKPKNTLEKRDGTADRSRPKIADDAYLKCPDCDQVLYSQDVKDHMDVCPECGHHFKMSVRRRLDLIVDPGTFTELDYEAMAPEGRESKKSNPIGFPGYEQKLSAAKKRSGEEEGVFCGLGKIGGWETGIFIMDPDFMMGSMGTAVGERITCLFEYALKKRLPVVGYTVSGGARMQEGILSLMQMAKVSGAVKRHSDAGLLYVVVLTDPTTGGVTASFAMEGDIILAEPKALIGFAGPRVIEQTILQKLPEGFQRAELLLEKGFVDDIVDRKRQKSYLKNLLELHSGKITI